jgi:hypothetical protein
VSASISAGYVASISSTLAGILKGQDELGSEMEIMVKAMEVLSEGQQILSATLQQVLEAATKEPKKSDIGPALRALTEVIKKNSEILEELSGVMLEVPERIEKVVEKAIRTAVEGGSG